MPVGTEQISNFSRKIQTLGQQVEGNLRVFGAAVGTNFRRFGENMMVNVKNMRNENFQTKCAEQQWAYQVGHDGLAEIRSVRKLFDVIEQKYSYISITLLLLNTGFEATAVGIYLRTQRVDEVDKKLHFNWGIGGFIVLQLLSVIFLLGWIGLLLVENKKISYLFKLTSIMTYLSSMWMLMLGFLFVVTGKELFRETYAPMFLRIWWLHECVLTLLDYPQISAFFSDNRLEMVRSLVQCFAVIGMCVGTLQAVENYYGDSVDFYTLVYMMLVVFSTIGYGDIVLRSIEGRLLLIIFIGIGISYFVPMLEYVATLGVEHLRHRRYWTWFKEVDHVVLCGDFDIHDLRIQLTNLFAGKRHYFNMHVVVMLPDQPSAEILLLVNAPMYRSSVSLLVGDPGNSDDLDRCNVRGAAAIFLFGRGANSSYYSDYETAEQTISTFSHVPDVPLHVLLHRSRYTKAMMPKVAKIVEIERLNHNLLGLGCVLPGMIPLVVNLIRMFDPMTTASMWDVNDFSDPRKGALAVAKAMRNIGSKQRDMMSYSALAYGSEHENPVEPFWKDLYEASLAQHVEVIPLPASQCMRSFRSLATLLYSSGITLIGVVRKHSPPKRNIASPDATPTTAAVAMAFDTPSAYPNEPIVELAPRGNLRDVVSIIIICDDRVTVDAAIGLLPSVTPNSLDDFRDFDEAASIGALKDLVERQRGLVGSFALGRSISNASFAQLDMLSPRSVGSRNPSPRASAMRDSRIAGEIIPVDAISSKVKPLSFKPAKNVTIMDDAMQRPPSSPALSIGLASPTSRRGATNLSFTSDRSAESMAQTTRDRDRGREGERAALRIEQDANNLKNHFVFIDLSMAHELQQQTRESKIESLSAKAADFFDIMRPARQHTPLSSIVLLASEDNYEALRMMWEDDVSGSIIVIQGSGLFLRDLVRCNLKEAAAVVIFCAGDRCDEHGDAISIIVAKTVRQLCREGKSEEEPDTPVVVELDRCTCISLLSGCALEDTTNSQDWVMEPCFLSGNIVCRHMLDTALQEAYFVPELKQVLEQLLSGWQDALSVTSILMRKEWKRYKDVVDYCLGRRLLPLAIHRQQEEIHDDFLTTFRYIITNPPPPFLTKPDDIVYCLKVR